MERKAFQAWFAQLAHLTEQQQAKVKSALEKARREVAAPEVINQRAAEVAACPAHIDPERKLDISTANAAIGSTKHLQPVWIHNRT